tara:strand:- start:916 stop:1518 length:603 start_codon:yes stop_codon:yes gene_type:complete
MAKVVINNSFGGFMLPSSTANQIAAATGFCPVAITWGDIPRHLPELVQAVEALSSHQRGSLVVVEVNGPYRISEYDGCESITEMCEQDWIDPEAEIQYNTYNRLPSSPEDNMASFDSYRIKGMSRSYGRKERRRFRCRPRRTVKFREVGTTEVELFGDIYVDKVYQMMWVDRKGKRPAQKPKGKTLADKRKLFAKIMPEA